MKYLLPFALLLLSGCFLNPFTQTPQERKKSRNMRKIERAVNRFPELAKDTVLRIDTAVISKGVRIDTAFVLDSVFIARDKLRIRYVRRNDTTYITGECLEDTIYIKESLSLRQIVVQKSSKVRRFLRSIWWVFLLVIFGYGIYLVFRKFN